MTTNQALTNEAKQPLTAKTLFNSDQVQKKFSELLGKRASAFITSVLQVITNNDLLSKADPITIYHAATVAATLDLPINNNLGFAYIVPYNSKQGCVAQFQMGYKGFIQLALRSGQFNKISSTEVYEGQLIKSDPLKGNQYDFTKKDSDKIIGYVAYFRLVNGFEAELFMTLEQLNKHGKKYSQQFKKGTGLWNDDFHSMATKTVIKLLLSRFAPLSIEMQKAIALDQGIIKNEDATDVTYIDNTPEPVDHEFERAKILLQDCKNDQALQLLWSSFGDDMKERLQDIFENKVNELMK